MCKDPIDAMLDKLIQANEGVIGTVGKIINDNLCQVENTLVNVITKLNAITGQKIEVLKQQAPGLARNAILASMATGNQHMLNKFERIETMLGDREVGGGLLELVKINKPIVEQHLVVLKEMLEEK